MYIWPITKYPGQELTSLSAPQKPHTPFDESPLPGPREFSVILLLVITVYQ